MSINIKSALSALCVAVTLTPRVPRAISTSHEDISFPCTISCRGVRMPTHHEERLGANDTVSGCLDRSVGRRVVA